MASLASVPLTSVSGDASASPNEPRRYENARNRRNILCVFPHYSHSFGTFDHAFPLMGVKAFMPPQGLLVITAYLPAVWEVRFIDENIHPATDRDYDWADAVFISGMHVQAEQMRAINRKAQAHGKITVLGGPSVSGCPEWFPEIDILHIGELGDATDALIARLDADVARPPRQEVYTTQERVPLAQFPLPAYNQLNLQDYFLASVQFSSGCPFLCEFCDIPALYGRNPRLKSPTQVTAELDAMLARGNPGCVYFVDDNFIGNRKAAIELLRELGRWQQERGYPVQFACEATLNIAQSTEVLELMREAYFTTVFCGIETPESNALKLIHKEQNLRQPIHETVRTLNDYGLEVVSGIILGLDSDTPSTGDRIVEFIEATQIPMLTINILHALPKTPLWDRLERAGRIVDGRGRDSNVQFLLPDEVVTGMWRECIRRAYSPEALYARFAHQIPHTFANRKSLPVSRARLNPPSVRRALSILRRLFWKVGVRSDYRRLFWQMALPALRRADIEAVIHIGIVAHHLILFARECMADTAEKSFYSPDLHLGSEAVVGSEVAAVSLEVGSK